MPLRWPIGNLEANPRTDRFRALGSIEIVYGTWVWTSLICWPFWQSKSQSRSGKFQARSGTQSRKDIPAAAETRLSLESSFLCSYARWEHICSWNCTVSVNQLGAVSQQYEHERQNIQCILLILCLRVWGSRFNIWEFGVLALGIAVTWCLLVEGFEFGAAKGFGASCG